MNTLKKNLRNLCLILLLGWLLACDGLQTGPKPKKRLQIHIGPQPLRVEIVASARERERGLMYRSQLRANEGMLFIFPYPRKVAFWMKNTLIPLDVGYFNPQLRLIEYKSMQPDNGAKTYRSSDLTLYAVETNVGWYQKHQIRKNMLLKLPHKISAR